MWYVLFYISYRIYCSFEIKIKEKNIAILVASISNKENEQLEYLGAIIYGNAKDVNEITGKFQLWRID